tara:strand:+ start:1191 stop:1475 length:285 start_codon:yes stop_codon:yes gene_type:complete
MRSAMPHGETGRSCSGDRCDGEYNGRLMDFDGFQAGGFAKSVDIESSASESRNLDGPEVEPTTVYPTTPPVHEIDKGAQHGIDVTQRQFEADSG